MMCKQCGVYLFIPDGHAEVWPWDMYEPITIGV